MTTGVFGMPRTRITILVLGMSATAFSLLQSLVTPVLPVIQHELHTTQSTVTWVITAWLLSAAVATPLLGRIGDMVGKRRTLVLALTAVAVGCLVSAWAPSIWVLILGRVLQGLGGAVFPLSFGIIRDEFPAHRIAATVGGMSAIIAVGGGLGTVLAGPIDSALGWRWLFWIPMAVLALTAVAAHFLLAESANRPGGRINWTAATLLAGWLISLLLPLSQGSRWGWGAPSTVGLLVLSVALFVLWVRTELRSPVPIIDMTMMRLPAVWTTNLVALLYGASFFAVFAFLPQFTQAPAGSGYGFASSLSQTGLIVLPMTVTMAVAGFASGPLARFVNSRRQLVLAASLTASSSIALALVHDTRIEVAGGGAVFGLGLGLGYAAMANLIVQGVPAAQTGVASGMNTNIRTIGGAIGTAVTSGILSGHLQASGVPAEAGFTTSFLIFGGVAGLSAVLALLIPTGRPATPDPVVEIGGDRAVRAVA